MSRANSGLVTNAEFVTANFGIEEIQSGILRKLPTGVLISIRDKDDLPPVVDYAHCRAIEFFVFSDVDTNHPDCITSSDIERLVRFIRFWFGKEHIYAHCAAGHCRSGAVSFILERLGYKLHPLALKQIPNLTVKNALSKAFSLGLSADELKADLESR